MNEDWTFKCASRWTLEKATEYAILNNQAVIWPWGSWSGESLWNCETLEQRFVGLHENACQIARELNQKYWESK